MTQPAKILFVDDESQMLTALKRVFRGEEFEVSTANSGQEGLQLLESTDFDVIISDMRMPEMDGAAFLALSCDICPGSRRILLTGYSDQDSTVRAINEGQVHQYLTKPWDNNQLRDAVMAEWKEKQSIDANSVNFEEYEQLKSQVDTVSKDLENATSLADMAKESVVQQFNTTIRIISNLIHLRIPSSGVISEDIIRHSVAMAKILKLSNKVVAEYRHAARLYQLGKLSFPEKLLDGPLMELSKAELEYYYKHAEIGADLLTPLSSLDYAANLIRHQYENYDGTGQPDGLAANKIPLGSRILRMVIDYHLLCSGLYFKDKYSGTDAIEYLAAHSGTKYDPDLQKVYAKLLTKLTDTSTQLNDRIRKTRELIPGEVISRDLINQDGVLLVSKGTVLSVPIIDKLIDIEVRCKRELNAFVLRGEREDVPAET